jgi:hypothetical protein
MLERGLGVIVDQASGHHEVLGDPVAVVALEGPELADRAAVELAPGDIRVDLRRPLAVGAVRDPQVSGVVRAGALLTVGPLVAVEAPGRTVITLERTTLTTVLAVELPRTTVVTLGTVTERTTLTTVLAVELPRTTVVTLERTTLTTVITLERTTLTTVITLERTTLTTVITLERTTLTTVVTPALTAVATPGLPIVAVAVGAALPELIVTVAIPESARPSTRIAGTAERAASPVRAAAVA